MTLPQGIDLDQYRTQAKELLKQIRAAEPAALDRLRQHHPEHATPAAAGSIRLADTQLVLAHENGFPSWARFRDYLLFRNAVQALDAGDLPGLEALLDKHPSLLGYHCRTGEWYAEGYFAGATLLNHIAGNPIRCPIPPNILDITRLLLRKGARDTPPRPNYTIGLLLTSRQASEAGVAVPLIDLLMEAKGTQIDLTSPDTLDGPLRNQAPATAEALIRRGARMRLTHAAALGRLDLVKRFVLEGAALQTDASLIPLSEDPQEAKAEKEQAFIDACRSGQTDIAEFLLEQGVDPSSQGRSGQTGLHFAAHSGHPATVRMLLAHHVPLEEKNMYGGTVLGQALWSACNEPQPDHLPIIESLIAAGAQVAPQWREQIDEMRRHQGKTS
ncbi:MAG: Ankyrin [Chthonomonadales bacterium]|nr:Ankyrin [Chthonomonadales bacterium]